MPPKRKNTPLRGKEKKVQIKEKTTRKSDRKKKIVLEPVPLPTEELPGLLPEDPVIIDENATVDGFCDFCLEIVKKENLFSVKADGFSQFYDVFLVYCVSI